jgi:GTPase SAR1 family protein
MEEFGLGPNGGLVYCLEFLLEHVDWLEEDLEGFSDEFLIIDCPGQIELYTHYDIMPKLIAAFTRHDYRVAAVYLLESQFFQDITKFFAGVLNATSAMMQLGVAHLNVISKMDLLEPQNPGAPRAADGEDDDDDVTDESHPLHRYFYPDPALLAERLSEATRPKFYRLNEALVQLIDEFDMVNFIPLNPKKESSLIRIMGHIDQATQFSEGLEPKEPRELDDQEDGSLVDDPESYCDYGLEDQD